MRNSTSGSTPKTNTVQDDSVSNNAEKISAKKLKQARLPFKVIAPGTSPVGSKTTTAPAAVDKDKDTNSTDGRKRKLSYDDSDDEGANVIDADDNVSKENVEILKAATKKKKLSTVCNNDATSEIVVSLLDDDVDDDDDEGNNPEDVANSSISVSAVNKKDLALKTPKATVKDKRKGAGTPQTSSAQKDKHGSASKLQIKLPLSAGKKKRRKSKLQQLSLNNSAAESSHNNSAQELSSDDIEDIAVELNPHKRKKLNTEDDDETKKAKTSRDDQEQEVEIIALDSESEEENKQNKGTEIKKATKRVTSKKPSKQSVKGWAVAKTASKEKESNAESSPQNTNNSSEKSSENDDVENIKLPGSSEEDEEEDEKHKEDLDESVLSDNDNEADDETDNLTGKAANISSDIGENSKSNPNNTLESLKDGKSTSSSSKNQTPKQVRLMEQRRKAREEKERKLQDEKMKKQQEKEDKELSKKREREEKEEQRRKEREEKEEQRRKERDEKERKRLAEIEAKNEEKRKKNEAKEEELRKKEEERKRKEQEKEEAELKKKKAAQAFTKFFVAKTPNQTQLKHEEDSNTGDDTKQLAFRPFQIKGDMKLAPIVRKMFTTKERSRLDELSGSRHVEDDEEVVRRKPLPKTQLYLNELRSGKVLPGKWRRASTESKDDVILVDDELERVGQEIVEDSPAYIREEMRVKFYKFHDNRRPPYYGTWRKKSSLVKPRKPFAQDKKFFDYDVDSDDEWEEEEPGESLEDGSDDDKEKESEDEDYEVDNEWFVPHGHLSDEELQNEDEFGMGDDNTREAQKAKLQILQQEFAQEMKKKTEKIKPRLIGCIWTDINGNQPPECARILWETLEKKAMLFTEPPLVEEPEADRPPEPSSPSSAPNGHADKTTTDKLKHISLSDNMVKDLTRLVHGNNHSKNFLINEYIAYVEKTELSVKNGDLRKPMKTVVRDKIEEMAEWQAIDATASTMQDLEQANDDATADSTKKKKKGKKRLCWVVKQEMLNKMDLPSLELQNSWEYTLPPKFVKSDKEVKTDESENISTTPAVAEDGAKGKNTAATTPQITKFTKVLTAEEKATKLLNSPASTTSNDKSGGSEPKSNTPTTSKEKKRVPLLMSVARGQQIPTPAKNKLISQFLQQKSKDDLKQTSPSTSRSKTVTSPQVEDDDVVILD
ncbi:chromatin assembly factor 1 subunit A [Calliphora vicina]|uniref:chromatin assembly factor 1 subunit A n=1 Tax=Calliphora vicina TaxID=7373 RepID=UPI00325B384E